MAAFFESFGFRADAPDVLVQALLTHATACGVAMVRSSKSGTKCEVSGPLPAPDGRMPVVKSVWIIDTGSTMPRFVTAVPS